jgi:hypothetical protein
MIDAPKKMTSVQSTVLRDTFRTISAEGSRPRPPAAPGRPGDFAE